MRERIAFRVGLRKMPMLNAIWCGLQIRAWRERWTRAGNWAPFISWRTGEELAMAVFKIHQTSQNGNSRFYSYRMRLKVPSLAETGKVELPIPETPTTYTRWGAKSPDQSCAASVWLIPAHASRTPGEARPVPCCHGKMHDVMLTPWGGPTAFQRLFGPFLAIGLVVHAAMEIGVDVETAFGSRRGYL